MYRQVRILHHVVLIVREYVAFAFLRDCAQLHSQRIASRPIMLHRVIVAAGAVEELAATQYASVGQIEPEILCEVAFLALPATWWDLLAVVQLFQVRGVSEKPNKVRILKGKPLQRYLIIGGVATVIDNKICN